MSSKKKYGVKIIQAHWDGRGDDFVFKDWYRKESSRDQAHKLHVKRMKDKGNPIISVDKIER